MWMDGTRVLDLWVYRHPAGERVVTLQFRARAQQPEDKTEACEGRGVKPPTGETMRRRDASERW